MNSQKLQVVDEKTFANLQNSLRPDCSRRKIHNSKYKRSAANKLNLWSFARNVKHTRNFLKKTNLWLRQRRSPRSGNIHRLNIYHCKRSKVLSKRFKSKLKKTINAHRQQKRLKRDNQNINELVGKLTNLHVNENVASNAKDQMEVGTPLETETSATTPCIPKKQLHSRRFRSYCENCTTQTLCNLTEQFLREISSFQHRSFMRNQIKAAAHRRYVLGFREVNNLLNINKLKIVIIATDCEECNLEGGLDETIQKIKETCRKLEVPIVFALRRRQLSYCLFKSANISCVGVLNFDGAISTFQQLLTALGEARELYKQFKQLIN